MMVTQTTNQWEKAVGKLIARAWSDSEFYQCLVNNTAEVLQEAGVAIEDFAKVVVNQNPTEAPGLRVVAAGNYEICLPPQPTDMVSEQLLADTSASVRGCYCCCCCCCH